MSEKKSSRSRRKSGPRRLKAGGDLTGKRVFELKDRFSREIGIVEGSCVLDLTGVKIVDSRGISLCIGLYKECLKKNCRFSIEAPAAICGFFRMLKLDRYIELHEIAETQ